MSRRRFSERETLETLLLQGIALPCYRCKEPMKLAEIEREHLHELALGGLDQPVNCAYSHKECHATITNGTKATSAGSSKHRIAKTRGTRAAKFAVVKKRIDEPREPKIPWRRQTFKRARA